MSRKTRFPPRQGDLPREQLMAAARKAIADVGGGQAWVYFKFTCPDCGERCKFTEKNQLFENGECHRCGRTNPVQFGGFALELHL